MADRTSRARVRAALDVLRRGSTAGSAGAVAYVVYVVAIFGFVYGFTYGRTIFAALGGERLAELARQPVTVTVLVLGYGGLLGLARRGGRVTGPVAPPPIWTHHVVSAPVDREVALRRWWWLALGGLLGTGTVLGVLLGLSLWSAGITGPLGVPVSAAGLVLAALLLAHVWLSAQASSEPPTSHGRAWSTRSRLRRLSVEGLLAQTQRREALALSAVSGDTETIREQVGGTRPTAVRGALRPGPWPVLRRDLLALRRGALGGAAPFVLVVAGGWLAASAIPAGLPAVAAVAAVVLHVAATGWAGSLRRQAARSGLPPLLGWSPVQEATRHLALPVLLLLLAVGGGAAIAAATTPDPVLVLPFALVPLVLGTATWSAFRAGPDLLAVMPQTLVASLVLWWVSPHLLVLVVTGGALLWSGGTAAAALPVLVGGLVLLGWSITTADR